MEELTVDGKIEVKGIKMKAEMQKDDYVFNITIIDLERGEKFMIDEQERIRELKQ